MYCLYCLTMITSFCDRINSGNSKQHLQHQHQQNLCPNFFVVIYMNPFLLFSSVKNLFLSYMKHYHILNFLHPCLLRRSSSPPCSINYKYYHFFLISTHIGLLCTHLTISIDSLLFYSQ